MIISPTEKKFVGQNFSLVKSDEILETIHHL